MAEVYTKEDLMELNKRVKEEEMAHETNKFKKFLYEAQKKFIYVKDSFVEDYNNHPEWYHGFACAAIGALGGMYIGHRFIKDKMNKHGYVSVNKSKDGDLTNLEFGYTGLLGKHKYLTVINSNAAMAALGERLISVANGSINSTTTF